MLTVLENDAAKGKTLETTKYKLSKAIIQNCFYGTQAVLPVWGPLYLLYIRCTASHGGLKDLILKFPDVLGVECNLRKDLFWTEVAKAPFSAFELT